MSQMNISRITAWAAASAFVTYTAVTVAVYLPVFAALTSTEVFSVGKHVVVALVLAAVLIWKPKIGSLVAAAWGAIVPFERYVALAREIADGVVYTSGTFATSDVARIALLFLATVLSLATVLLLHAGKPRVAAPASADV